MTAQDDVQRILSLLKRVIRSSGLSQKEVDRRIGVQPGYLSQVMIGRLDLKLKHLLRALDAIEVDPSAFFQVALGGAGATDASGVDLLSLLPPSTNDADRRPQPEPFEDSLSDAELEHLVARALAEELELSPEDPLLRKLSRSG